MNINLNMLPKLSFKSLGNAAAQPQQISQSPQTYQHPQTYQSSQPMLNPQPKADLFDKSSTQTVASKYSEPKYTQTDIFYINDNHGRIGNMARIYSAKEFYDSNMKSSNADKLVLAAGDISAGADLHLVEAANKYMNGIGVDATSDGNHEYDANPADIAKSKQGAKFKSLGMNLQIPKGNPLDGIIEKSFVIDKNGHKYAIIGLAPPDLHERIRDNESRKQIGVDDFEKTLKDVQAKIDEYKQQGINKVILLSHCGLAKDQRLAKEISGIDIIIGGHTHDLLKGIEEGKNLLYSKSNEPVIITQAGKDGEYFGDLKITWDDKKGIIVKAQNNVTASSNFKRNRVLKGVFDHILGKPEHLGEIKSAPGPVKNRLLDPNPDGFFIMDAVRHEFNTDLALINVGNIRGFFEPGPLDSRQVFEVVPLKNNMVKMKLTEKEVVDALKHGAKSFVHSGNKPGIVIPSGLKYTVTRGGELKSATFIDKSGKEIPIDVNNPDPNKVYTVATDDFFASGGDNLIPNKIKTGEVDEKFDFDKDKLACDYIKKLNTPIEIKDDGRIKIVDQ